MHKIFELLGAKVTWNDKTQTVTGTKGDRTVKMTIGQKEMFVNKKKILLDTPPIIMSARTLVPVRAVAEGLGCNVNWDERYNKVTIKPKNFVWSEWDEDLPNFVDEDLYYIEERDEFRVRTREKEYFSLDFKVNSSNFLREEISYGEWRDWQDGYISESENLEVMTRTERTPKRYHYAHYCTGRINDKDSRYRTWSKWWHDECTYHNLGWFDSPLSYSEDSTDDYVYYVDGENTDARIPVLDGI